MRTVLAVVAATMVFVAMFLGLSIGLGEIVHWSVPKIEIGMASVLGALTLTMLWLVVSTVFFAMEATRRAMAIERAEQMSEDDEDSDDNSLGPGDIDELGASIANALMARQRMWSMEATAREPKKRTPRKR